MRPVSPCCGVDVARPAASSRVGGSGSLVAPCCGGARRGAAGSLVTAPALGLPGSLCCRVRGRLATGAAVAQAGRLFEASAVARCDRLVVGDRCRAGRGRSATGVVAAGVVGRGARGGAAGLPVAPWGHGAKVPRVVGAGRHVAKSTRNPGSPPAMPALSLSCRAHLPIDRGMRRCIGIALVFQDLGNCPATHIMSVDDLTLALYGIGAIFPLIALGMSLLERRSGDSSRSDRFPDRS
ncbi:MAG: hypothetical protein QOI59_1468 [Gammaproteobacteria bacterium]|nr:hypothetical protein [Gammaproteobacteria bacterium]